MIPFFSYECVRFIKKTNAFPRKPGVVCMSVWLCMCVFLRTKPERSTIIYIYFWVRKYFLCPVFISDLATSVLGVLFLLVNSTFITVKEETHLKTAD